MPREHLGMRLLDLWKSLVDRTCDDQVELFPAGLEQCFVGRVAYKRVLELVGGVGCDAANIKEFRVDQDAQRTGSLAMACEPRRHLVGRQFTERRDLRAAADQIVALKDTDDVQRCPAGQELRLEDLHEACAP